MEESTFYNLEHLLFLMRDCPEDIESISIYKKWVAEDGYPIETISDILRTLSNV